MSCILKLDGNDYLTGTARGQIKMRESPSKEFPRSSTEPHPVLFLSLPESQWTAQGVSEVIASFYDSDDVFCAAFLSKVVVGKEEPCAVNPVNLKDIFSKVRAMAKRPWTIDDIYELQSPSNTVLPSGPYFLDGINLREAWRLHLDTHHCFQTPVLPVEGSKKFMAFNSLIDGDDGSWIHRIPVPSRCYSRPTKNIPLHGVRVSVKDNFSLAGLKTGLQNRAFFATYKAEEDTADYIKRLIDLGAVIVGKTKLSSFASGEKPCDWWEFLCPFNARADGHLNPGQSTTGGAASIGAYGWLDISIGSDSFGSVREPAAQNGAYGVRLTSDLSAPTKGLYPTSPGFDAIGFLGRDLDRFIRFARASLNKEVMNTEKYPQKIIYPTDFFPSRENEQQKIWDAFVAMLENFLAVEKTEVSLEKTWDACPPPKSGGRKFLDFTKGLVYNPFYYDGYHGTQSFRNDYEKKFNKKPYVTPHMQEKWDVGAGISKEEYEATLLDLQIFKQWFHDNILKPQSETGSTALLLLPIGPATPVFRDQFLKTPPRFGIDHGDLGAICALPQVVLPIGHIPYDSPKSGQTEYLPIAGSFAGARGSDLMLLNLAREALISADWPTTVSPGRFLFEPSERHMFSTNDNEEAPAIKVSTGLSRRCVMS